MNQQLVTPPSNLSYQETVQSYGKENSLVPRNTIQITQGKPHDANFNRFSVSGSYSPCWTTLELEEIKQLKSGNLRRTSICIEIDKKQIEQLINNLQSLLPEIKELPL